MMIDKQERIDSILKRMKEADEKRHKYFKSTSPSIPERGEVVRILKLMQSLMFPKYFYECDSIGKSAEEKLEALFLMLKRQISAAYSFSDTHDVVDTEMISLDLMDKLPVVKEKLIKDVLAIYEGDPAAVSPEEVILSYPGFLAIMVYRIAHEVYLEKIPYLSRMMTEYAHEKTGIDIHAGATIGEYFFIDHGTGVVIGETATIGDRVKIYQGVTLGAKSFELGDDGNPIKGIKRHPDIGNNCVIYANATILGGKTKIGDGSVIGAGVWIISSVEPGTTVYYGKK